MPGRYFVLIPLLCLASAAHAQSEATAHYQLYGGYTYLSNSFNGVPGSHQPLNGWDAALAFSSWHGLRFKLETFEYRGTNLGAPQNAMFILAGWQYSRRLLRESLFAEGLAGEANLSKNWPGNQLIGTPASFSTLLGGGVDTPIARHFAFRIDGGFNWSNFSLQSSYNVPYPTPGLPHDFGRISTGLVWGF